jgi:hypothetical protein
MKFNFSAFDSFWKEMGGQRAGRLFEQIAHGQSSASHFVSSVFQEDIEIMSESENDAIETINTSLEALQVAKESISLSFYETFNSGMNISDADNCTFLAISYLVSLLNIIAFIGDKFIQEFKASIHRFLISCKTLRNCAVLYELLTTVTCNNISKLQDILNVLTSEIQRVTSTYNE